MATDLKEKVLSSMLNNPKSALVVLKHVRDVKLNADESANFVDWEFVSARLSEFMNDDIIRKGNTVRLWAQAVEEHSKKQSFSVDIADHPLRPKRECLMDQCSLCKRNLSNDLFSFECPLCDIVNCQKCCCHQRDEFWNTSAGRDNLVNKLCDVLGEYALKKVDVCRPVLSALLLLNSVPTGDLFTICVFNVCQTMENHDYELGEWAISVLWLWRERIQDDIAGMVCKTVCKAIKHGESNVAAMKGIQVLSEVLHKDQNRQAVWSEHEDGNNGDVNHLLLECATAVHCLQNNPNNEDIVAGAIEFLNFLYTNSVDASLLESSGAFIEVCNAGAQSYLVSKQVSSLIGVFVGKENMDATALNFVFDAGAIPLLMDILDKYHQKDSGLMKEVLDTLMVLAGSGNEQLVDSLLGLHDVLNRLSTESGDAQVKKVAKEYLFKFARLLNPEVDIEMIPAFFSTLASLDESDIDRATAANCLLEVAQGRNYNVHMFWSEVEDASQPKHILLVSILTQYAEEDIEMAKTICSLLESYCENLGPRNILQAMTEDASVSALVKVLAKRHEAALFVLHGLAMLDGNDEFIAKLPVAQVLEALQPIKRAQLASEIVLRIAKARPSADASTAIIRYGTELLDKFNKIKNAVRAEEGRHISTACDFLLLMVPLISRKRIVRLVGIVAITFHKLENNGLDITSCQLLKGSLNDTLAKPEAAAEGSICGICMDLKVDMIINPCHHTICEPCSKQMIGRVCPFCKVQSQGFHKFYLS